MTKKKLIFLLLTVLALTACAPKPAESTGPNEIITYPSVSTTPTSPKKPEIIAVTPSGTTESDEELRQVTAQVLTEKYGVNLSPYTSRITRYDDGDAHVCYTFGIYGYTSMPGDITAYFHADGTLYSIYNYSEDITKYLPYITEEAVQAAVAKLEQQASAYEDVNPYYYQIDQEGYLCLGVEIIVEYEPTQTDSQGNLIHGCGYDHDHIFLRERICHYS